MEQVPKPLDLVRYNLAWSVWAVQFYDYFGSQWKVEIGKVSTLIAHGNRCGNRAHPGSQYNSERCFTEAIVLHICMAVWA